MIFTLVILSRQKKNNKYAIFARKDTARKTCGDLAGYSYNNYSYYFIIFSKQFEDDFPFINAIYYKSYFPVCSENARCDIEKAWRPKNKLKIDEWDKKDFIDFYDKIKSEININD